MTMDLWNLIKDTEWILQASGSENLPPIKHHIKKKNLWIEENPEKSQIVRFIAGDPFFL